MKKIVLSIATMAAALSAAAKAHAAPDHLYNCGDANNCLEVDNSGPAVVGSSANSIAVYGATSSSSQPAVRGSSFGGYIGVYGTSTTGNGVVGLNTRTDQNAAAISAISGSNSGLAYWGTGSIIVTGDAFKPGGGTWKDFSDERVKKDVKDFRQGLAELKRLRPVAYKFNGLAGTQDNGKEYVGVIAQELEKVLPAMVSSKKAKLHPSDADETDLKQVDSSNFTYILINSVQEQQKVIERQDARIAMLERGHAPLMSSLATGGLGGVALGLLPLGLIARRRKAHED
jgi:hypothetical protein